MAQQIEQLPAVPREILIVLGKAMTLARRQKKWSQTTLAKRIGVSRQKVARMEKGDPRIDVATVITAAWLLNVPLITGIDFSATQSKDFLTLLVSVLDKQLQEKMSKKRKVKYEDF